MFDEEMSHFCTKEKGKGEKISSMLIKGKLNYYEFQNEIKK